ncbi:SynChlorMet cassette protein ScmD [Methanogenium sp. MK-MG]|uniref:SynChlorMet cassette protein ScmD n=1 Tax=Methanogenium sp. MK-MG TaxID=2599926 RepID=UPI0013EBE22B|nr:SynChlorMet cassette protein ScmD [Methanogenium sp. MK-MG]KAF1078137.1 hypothetical protein MKMG_00943 [Methanogenium sp. MK-MG]
MAHDPLPVANPSIVFREEFDDWALLFDPDTSESYGINPVGAYVWKQLIGSQDYSRLVDDVGSVFEDVPETAPEEIRAFLDALIEKGYAGYEAEQI